MVVRDEVGHESSVHNSMTVRGWSSRKGTGMYTIKERYLTENKRERERRRENGKEGENKS